MDRRKFLSLMLCLILISTCLPGGFVFADSSKKSERTIYLHAQGTNPASTTDVSTVYMGENTDVYFAVDNPNKGLFENGTHKEPQYDLNGYTVTIYFDPEYFDYAADSDKPIDYTVPDKSVDTSTTGQESGQDVPTTVGYYPYAQGSGQGSGSEEGYSYAYVTVFFNGGYAPQKDEEQLWYNLCKLSLTPKKTGSTQVFIDTSTEAGKGLELFAKNNSDKLEDQTFRYTAVNGGSHTIIIKEKSRPAVPTASPSAGSYDESQSVTLTAESGCEIYYSTDGTSFEKYTLPIKIETSQTITCYAKRVSDGKTGNRVKYEYSILPKSPRLFDSSKALMPNIYTSDDAFTVYIADKDAFGSIDAENELYYTFSSASTDSLASGTNPETEWVKVDKRAQSLEIDKSCTLRLVSKRLDTLSDVSEYRLSIKPARTAASPASGSYDEKQDVTLSSATSGAKIFYTLDGSDPRTNGMEYSGVITLANDTTLRAVTLYDGAYSEISSFYYIFTSKDDYSVDAFYPSGVYEGSVNVTLTAGDPENELKYSSNGGSTYQNYENTLIIDEDTDILVKAVDKDGNEGAAYTFKYRIKPLEPVFAPESTQFTNADKITVNCIESEPASTSRFDLYYTLDGSDPVTSSTRIKAEDDSDSAEISIAQYTVIKAVVLKDGETYSNVVTNSYDIVSKKPSRPLMSLEAGNYTEEISSSAAGEDGYSTQFLPVAKGTEIYYTISYDGSFVKDPVPNTAGTVKYDGNPIEIKGDTIIKAVAVNAFGVKSDIGIFEYTVTPEAPKAAPSSTIGGSLPVVPVSAVKGSTIKYEINGFENEFKTGGGSFYIDTSTGNAYKDEACTESLGTQNQDALNVPLSAPVTLEISAEKDGIESEPNRYVYDLSSDTSALAAPYADKETGEYEEISQGSEGSLLLVSLASLNNGDTIQYRTENGGTWNDYSSGAAIKIKGDTILQIRSKKGENYSPVVSYVYSFVPLAPVITLQSGRYLKSDAKTIEIVYDDRAPLEKVSNDYKIMYRENGDKQDYVYSAEREINHTMSFKAYVINTKTGKVSKNTIHYYIIEPESSATGGIYVASPYDSARISSAVLSTSEYAKGIKLLTQKNDVNINYYYTYTLKDGDTFTTQSLVYDNVPIMVNSSMESIKITAWLTDSDGGEVTGSRESFSIDFVDLPAPKTSLDIGKIEFAKGTTYTLVNNYFDDESILLYYTLDGSEPSNESSTSRKIYSGETLTLNAAATVKTVYFSACGACTYCKDDKPQLCSEGVYGTTGVYRYTVPTVISGGGSGGSGGGSGGGGSGGSGSGSGGSSGGSGSGGSGSGSSGDTTPVVDNVKKYTVDMFGNEHQTHTAYINGYPDGSVRPEDGITREEITSVMSRIIEHSDEIGSSASGTVFSDIDASRWSADDIEYMVEKNIVTGYPDGEFKPENKLTRAEFAALVSRLVKLESKDTENPFSDLDESHWAYSYILALNASGLMQGYEDGTYRPESNITRAEVVTVMNKILGRNPSESYVTSLSYKPFSDLEKDKWYYTAVLEATVTHNYELDDKGVEIRWEW